MMWVDIYHDDKDSMALWVIIIPFINSVGLLLFSTFWPMSGRLFVWILLFTRSALASDIPGTWDFVQLSHACWFLGFDVFVAVVVGETEVIGSVC